jgi:hypothetical protein
MSRPVIERAIEATNREITVFGKVETELANCSIRRANEQRCAGTSHGPSTRLKAKKSVEQFIDRHNCRSAGDR